MKCASCDIDLGRDPLVIDGEPFCCPGCGQGGPCTCTYEAEQRPYPGNGQVDPAAVPDVFDEGL